MATSDIAPVPFFGTVREFAANRDAIMARVEDVLASGRMLQGPAVERFERRVADQVGRKHGIAVGSCTDALAFALMAAGVGPGDEVLVTDFSFIASASCILRVGAAPVFVDIDETCNMDLDQARTRISPRTRAVIYVHLFGQMGDPAAIEMFAAENGLTLIEDAAQTIGAAFNGRAAGSLGAVSCISFDPTKPLAAPGSGGVALTDDDVLAETLRALRYHGKDASGQFAGVGFNSQMPTLTAAVLDWKLDRDHAWAEARRNVAHRYLDGFRETGLALPSPPPEARHIYHKFVIRCPHGGRDAVKAALADDRVETNVHYAIPLHRHPVFRAGRGNLDNHFPEALAAAEDVLSLPIHPFLEDDEIERVIASVCRAMA